MKKIICIILLAVVLSTGTVFASKTVAIGASGDLSAAWKRPVSLTFDFRVTFEHIFRTRAVVTYDRGDLKSVCTSGFILDVYPFGVNNGMFFGIMPLELGFLFSNKFGNTDVYYFNEIHIGWTQGLFNNNLTLEAELCIKDPFTISNDAFNKFALYTQGFNSRFEFRVLIGFSVDVKTEVVKDNKTSSTKTKKVGTTKKKATVSSSSSTSSQK